jgi:hypothetical protein
MKPVQQPAAIPLPWSNAGNIPDAAIELIKKSEFDLVSYPWECLRTDPILHGRLKELRVHKNAMSLLIRERQKSIASRNATVLERTMDDVPDLREELMESTESLKDIAVRYTVTTTDLAIVMVGAAVLRAAIDNIGEGEISKNDSTAALRRAHEAVLCGGDDRLTSFKLRSRDFSLVPERFTASGEEGESILEQDLRAARILFKNDPEQVAKEFAETPSGSRAVPDALLESPLRLFGKDIHWIDAKNALMIPGLTPAEHLDRLEKQMRKYTERFGSGAILWTRGFFSPQIAHNLPSEVLHLRRDGMPVVQLRSAKAKPMQLSALSQSQWRGPPVMQQYNSQAYFLPRAPAPPRVPAAPRGGGGWPGVSLGVPGAHQDLFASLAFYDDMGIRHKLLSYDDDDIVADGKIVHTIFGNMSSRMRTRQPSRMYQPYLIGKRLGGGDVEEDSTFLFAPDGNPVLPRGEVGDVVVKIRIRSTSQCAAFDKDETAQDLIDFIIFLVDISPDMTVEDESTFTVRFGHPPKYLTRASLDTTLADLNMNNESLVVDFDCTIKGSGKPY